MTCQNWLVIRMYIRTRHWSHNRKYLQESRTISTRKADVGQHSHQEPQQIVDIYLLLILLVRLLRIFVITPRFSSLRTRSREVRAMSNDFWIEDKVNVELHCIFLKTWIPVRLYERTVCREGFTSTGRNKKGKRDEILNLGPEWLNSRCQCGLKTCAHCD
jgi:hypothetical protein